MSDQHYCPHCALKCNSKRRYIECYHCHQRFHRGCYDGWFGVIDPTDFYCHRCQIQHLTELVEQLELGREPLTPLPPTATPPPPPSPPPAASSSPAASEAASEEVAPEEVAVATAAEAAASSSSPSPAAATPPRRQSPPPREPTPTTPPRLPHHERYYSIFDKHK